MSIFLNFGCGNDPLPKYSILGRLQVLAVQASAPETAVGDVITLRTLVTDYGGEGTSMSLTMKACTDPGISRGAAINCDHDTAVQTQTVMLIFQTSDALKSSQGLALQCQWIC